MTSKLRLVVVAGVALIVCGGPSLWYMVGELLDPAPQVVGSPPAELNATNVVFQSASGSTIHGWFSLGEQGRGPVLLLHRVRGNRTDMLSRGLFLRALGYSVLLIDFQAHGESPGKHITFGDLESRDTTAAIGFLHKGLPGERIGAIGVSLGAAAIVLANKPLKLDAVVLESMYPTIEQAVADRLTLRLGAWSEVLAPVLIAVSAGWPVA